MHVFCPGRPWGITVTNWEGKKRTCVVPRNADTGDAGGVFTAEGTSTLNVDHWLLEIVYQQ